MYDLLVQKRSISTLNIIILLYLLFLSIEVTFLVIKENMHLILLFAIITTKNKFKFKR